MLEKNRNMDFTIKLGMLYYVGSIVIMLAITTLVPENSFTRINIFSFLLGSFLVLFNFGLSAYDLNSFLKTKKKSVFLAKGFARYALLIIMIFVLHKRFSLSVVVVAFEIMSFQLASIFINMFGLSGLLLEKE